MIRYVALTAAGLCMSLISSLALAQAEPAPPPPPVEEQPVESEALPSPEVRQRDADGAIQRQEARRERRRAEVERQRREFEREDGRADRERDRIERRHREIERFFRRPIPPPGPGIDPDSAWLGVQLSPVPAALAHHLNLADNGVMIANIFEGSPADQSGLDRYDIVIRADGEPAPGGVEAVQRFSEIVRDKKPGDTLELTVIRRGQETAFTVQLGEPPRDWRRLRLKYEEDPDVAHEREFGLRGRILRPGPHGWIMEELEELPRLREYLDRQFRGWQEPGRPPRAGDGRGGDTRSDEARSPRAEEARRVDPQGNVLHVQRDDDGTITVQRKQAGEEQAQSQTYENMDQLREQDEEAYDLLQSAIPQDARRPSRPGGVGRGIRPDRPAPADRPGRPDRPMGPGLRPAPAPPRGEAARPERPMPPDVTAPPASVRYQVANDGAITVHIREGDAEMTRTFKSREELRDKAPELFERYEELEARFGANGR